jgi:hypothetical protein
MDRLHIRRSANQDVVDQIKGAGLRGRLLLRHCLGDPLEVLVATVQRLGEIDAVCRTIERELISKPPLDEELDLRYPYCSMMSEVWIGTAYSICYILKDRHLRSDSAFLALAEDLRMIRVQLEKYELPSDRKLKTPLAMVRSPLRDDEIEPPVYLYDGQDNQRAHIGRRGLSARWSSCGR